VLAGSVWSAPSPINLAAPPADCTAHLELSHTRGLGTRGAMAVTATAAVL
jgi:hypothetical protein